MAASRFSTWKTEMASWRSKLGRTSPAFRSVAARISAIGSQALVLFSCTDAARKRNASRRHCPSGDLDREFALTEPEAGSGTPGT